MDEVDNSNLKDLNEIKKPKKSNFGNGWIIFGAILGLINGFSLLFECSMYYCDFSITNFLSILSKLTGHCCGLWVWIFIIIFIFNLFKKEKSEYPPFEIMFRSVLAFVLGVVLVLCFGIFMGII